MMLDPLRVKNRTGSKNLFRPRFLFFDFGWLKHLDQLLNYQFRFSNFPNQTILNQMKLFSIEFCSKQRSRNDSKRLLWCLLWALLHSSSRTLFRLFFLFYHTSTMTRPFFSLSESVVICHGLVLTVTPYVFERFPKWTVYRPRRMSRDVRGYVPNETFSTGSFQSFDDFISGLWFLHF